MRDLQKPLGVATYQLRDALPDSVQASLPSIEELEAELQARHDDGATP